LYKVSTLLSFCVCIGIEMVCFCIELIVWSLW